MFVHLRSLPRLAAGAVLLLAALPLPAARAEATKNGARVTIVLKDGFVLQGMVRREGKTVFEDGQDLFLPNGFFFLDDMPRRQYFSPSLMQQDAKEMPPSEVKPIHPKNWDAPLPSGNVPPVDEVLGSDDWNDRWERNVKFRSGFKERSVHQRLIQLTPYYAFTQATNGYSWPAMYLTSELGPDAVSSLLSTHPDYAEDPKLSPEARADRRFHYCDFMIQAGFYDKAEQELGRLIDDHPPDLKKVEDARGIIKQWRLRDQLEAINRMHNAGRFNAVRKQLADFDDKAADPKTAIKVNELRDKYKAADAATADATRFLDALPKQLVGGQYDAPLTEAAAVLRAELQPEILPRLDAFLGQAKQAERQAAAGQAPSKGPSQLLSLAVTGWLGVLPDETPARAARLWGARQFLLKYLAAEGQAQKGILAAYLAGNGQAPLDDFTRLIPLLPPIEPEEKITEDPVEATTGKGQNGVKYRLQLPPEYRPSRNYPVLIVLHQSGEEPKDMLARWSEAAALNGYILVAPEWAREAQDSDRVFLFGLGQGGAMAFDVGLSHPDQFAGVLPMSACPDTFSQRYYPNGQYLPFYIVDGDRSSKFINDNLRKQFDEWVNQYPMMWIQYKGRGMEWYGGEVASMFDWMRGKKREFPMEGVGGYNDSAWRKDFITQRATDNSFYWLTTGGIDARCINSNTNWDASVKRAMLESRIDLENNTIMLDTTGLTQITVWLGSNSQGVPMINFDNPLTVRWKSNTGDSRVVWKDKVAPSLPTLLEDLAARGDRQRLFTAKLEFSAK